MRSSRRSAEYEVRRQWATRWPAGLLLVALILGISTTASRVPAAVDRLTAPPAEASNVRLVGKAVEAAKASGKSKMKEAHSAWIAIALVAFAFGARVSASEWSHETLARSLLLQPRRKRWALNKLGAAFAMALVAAVAVGTICSVIAQTLSADAPGVPSYGDQGIALLVGILAVGLTAVLGAAAGMLARGIGATLAAAVIFGVLLENGLASQRPDIARWLPGHALEGASGHGIYLWRDLATDPSIAVLTLGAWAALFSGAAVLLVARRDVN